MHRPHRQPLLVMFAVLVGAAALLASCSSSNDSAATTTAAEATDDSATDDSRVVVIGEEYLLADVLALGVTPVASTATVADKGFQGLDDFDTEGIQALPATEPNLELLASLKADHVIALKFFADELGEANLKATAGKLTIVPDGLGPVEQVDFLAAALGREAAAADLVAEYDAAMARSKESLEGQDVSVAAIYSGPSVAAFVAGPWAVPATLVDSGVTLVPSAAEAEADRNGRAYLSMERLDLLAAPKLVLLTSPLIPGEAEAIAEVEKNPLWSGLPAVEAGAVTELDRLGYPGITGRIRLVDDLIAALA